MGHEAEKVADGKEEIGDGRRGRSRSVGGC